MSKLSLIPSFESEGLKALDNVSETLLGDIKSQLDEIKYLNDPDKVDAKFLPYLAYALKVDLWDEYLKESEKRAYIKLSYTLHKKKGTRWAILKVLEALGLSPSDNRAVIVEYKDRENYKYNVQRDGSHNFDGSVKYNHGLYIYEFNFGHWSEYAVIIKTSISEAQNTRAHELCEIYAPARCNLIAILTQVQQRDGVLLYDSNYTH